MSDDSGTRRPGPRRRTTRRLSRHAARVVLADVAVSPADGAIVGPVGVASDDSSPSEEPLTDPAAEGAPAESDGPHGVEHSPLLAALSAVPHGDAQGAQRAQAAQVANTDAEQARGAVGGSADAFSGATELVDETVADGTGGTEPDELPFVTDAQLPMARGLEPASPLEPESLATAPSVAKADRSDGAAAASGEADAEVQTRPKIRLPDGAVRRNSPRPVSAGSAGTGSEAESAGGGGARLPVQARRMSSAPPGPLRGGISPLPPPPDPAGRISRSPAVPTGEGIIRASQPAPRPSIASGYDRPDLDSDVPTRPRIPLTHDMALTAGRLTSLDLPRVSQPAEDGEDTHPRITVVPSPDAADAGPAPAVVVMRARMITGAPPAADAGEPERRRSRPSRRVRPESEEFETLDIEDGEEEPYGLDASESTLDGRVSDAGSRGRTPPPPPGQGQSKRGMSPAIQRPAPPPPPPPGAGKKPLPTRKAGSKRRAWWEVLFSDDYVRTLPRPEPALVAKQVAFMEASLGLSRGDAVLDVGCGLGQHALEFARRGYLVVALDLALSMITRAAEEAQQHNLRINFLHKDIRDIGFEGTFDAVVCVGTTFGFFDDEQNRGVLQRLAHALKPGGRLLLDVVNRDYVLASQPNLVWFEGDGCVVMEESDFNFYTSRLTVKRTMMREDGRQSESEYSVRLYSVHELGQLLKQTGFGIKEVSGQEATRGLFFGSHSSRIIMLAERRSSGRSQSGPPESQG
jgi:SAM-dependent methyltransferase